MFTHPYKVKMNYLVRMKKTSSRSHFQPSSRIKKKSVHVVRVKGGAFTDLGGVSDTLNRLSDPNYSGPLSEVADQRWPTYNKFVASEQRAWRLVLTVLEPLGMVHRLAMRNRRDRLNWAYSQTCMRFTHVLGRFAKGRLVVEDKTHWPHAEDSPVWLHATVELPQAIGFDNVAEYVAAWVWKVVFQEAGYEHLRRCLKCTRWYVYRGRNQMGRYCSPSCANRWWNRDRRRASAKSTKPRKGKKGAQP